MNKLFKFLFILLVVGISRSFIFCLEIPVQDFTVIRVGVVDMNQVISEYPNAQKLRQEIELFRQNKLSEVTNLEKEIDDLIKQKISLTTELEQLKTQLNQLSSTLITSVSSDTNKVEISSYNVVISSIQISTHSVQNNQNLQIEQINSAIQTKENNLKRIEETLVSKKQQLENKKREIDTEVQKMKDKAETNIYADLYKIIQQVAKQHGLNIVIDKSGIIYGEANIDITQEVIKKFK